jgi:magnesium chelatase subunit I
VKASVLEVFRARTRPEKLGELVSAFDEGMVVHTGDDVPASEYAQLLPKLKGLRGTLGDLGVGETPAGVASAVEFVLEGLHLSKRLNKDAVGTKATYRSRGGTGSGGAART